MRLIDGDALCVNIEGLEDRALSYLKELGPIKDAPHGQMWAAILAERSAFKYDIIDAPTIDAVPVVRCRDCKWFEPMPNRPDRKGFCHIWGALDEPRYCTNDDYCSNGKRKDGADND